MADTDTSHDRHGDHAATGAAPDGAATPGTGAGSHVPDDAARAERSKGGTAPHSPVADDPATPDADGGSEGDDREQATYGDPAGL